jgi:secreted trypsin-like serine protease
VDATNRYLFAVSIEAHPSAPEQEALKCSGVIIDPRLVLTAGHCVCPRQRVVMPSDSAAFIDGSACAARAFLMARTYLPPEREESARATHAWFEGVIHPHPELKVLLDEHGRVTSSHADLAVISLNTPLPASLQPVKLAKSEVKLHDALVIVGHGSDGSSVDLFGTRRFNKTQLASAAAGQERIFLASPKQPAFANDSGGPCLRETTQGSELIGISNRGLGQESSCTSTYFHKAWLQDELLKASQAQ